MIPLIIDEVVVNHSWITMEQMMDMITIAEMTPGPIAINIATFAGYRAAGVLGSAAATIGVITPSAIIVSIGAVYFLKHHGHPVVQAVLRGIRPVVVALIAFAGISFASNAASSPAQALIALAALLVSWRFRLHPIPLLAAGGILGMLIF
ncbi:MAG: chromate transporter [Bacillota bacterium]|jgi:chromate transporter